MPKRGNTTRWKASQFTVLHQGRRGALEFKVTPPGKP
jgi:hypothetical protein